MQAAQIVLAVCAPGPDVWVDPKFTMAEISNTTEWERPKIMVSGIVTEGSYWYSRMSLQVLLL